MIKPIPYGKQEITQEDIDAVTEALQSDYLTQGPKVKEFEDRFAEYVGAKYAVAVANGTDALHLAALALKVNPGDYVICTALTFAASVNCIKYCGAEVIFADIDPETYLIDEKEILRILEENTDKNIVGIIPVDFAGRVVDTEKLRQLAAAYDLWIIEDACHAPGGFFMDSQGKQVLAGSCTYSDIAIFSFHPVKHIACGEGGMLTTNNEALYSRLLLLRTHGITKDPGSFSNSMELANGSSGYDSYPGWYMEMQELGYNYRIPDVLCALGISQLKRADQGLEKRRQIAQEYTQAFKNTPGIIHSSGIIEGHAYHLYVLEVNNRRELYDQLRSEGIFAQIHYFPVHLMPYYRELGWKEGDLPNTEKYYSRCISIPMFPALAADQLTHVVNQIKNFYAQK